MLPWAMALLFVSAHNRSQGTSEYMVHKDGVVDVRVGLSDHDLPELCNVNFFARDRIQEEKKLTHCVTQQGSHLLRLRGDQGPCAFAFSRFEQPTPHDIVLVGAAHCPTPLRMLVIDFGLFAGTSLDHVSLGTVRLFSGAVLQKALSKRSSRWEIQVPRSMTAYQSVIIVVAVIVVACAIGLGCVAWFRRRNARRI